MAQNRGGDPLWSIFGPMGSHWVQTMDQNRKKLPCPKIRIFDYPTVIDFSQKMEVTVMAPNQGWDPLGSIFWPMGPIGSKKRVKTVKAYHAPKFEFSTAPRSSIFLKKMEVTVMAPNHGGDPLWSILVRMGSHWVQKWVKIVKNSHALKFEFSTSPRSSIFHKKWKIRLWHQITVGTLYGPTSGQWGPIGSKKWIKTEKNYHAQNSNFDYPAVIDFSQKMEVTVMASNHGGDPLGSILGPIGSHWVKKLGQNR